MKKSKKKIDRPDSYVVNEFTQGHLLLLGQRLESFIEAMSPAFARAEKSVSGTNQSVQVMEACVRDGEEPYRYIGPKNLLEWLENKASKLKELIGEVENERTNIDGKALNNLRQIRAFFVRFESIAKKEHGGRDNFQTAEPALANLLLEKFVPARDQGGVFEITRSILKDEKLNSTDDLGRIHDILKVGKTIKAVVKAQKALTVEKQEAPASPEPQREQPKPVAARAFIAELDLGDPRSQLPIKARTSRKSRVKHPDQPWLALS